MRTVLKHLIAINFFTAGLLVALPASGQSEAPGRYTGFIEFGGPAGLGSINVERRLATVPSWEVKARLGFLILPHGHLTKVPNSYFYPFGINFLKGRNAHHLETGIGGMLTVNNDGYLEGIDQRSSISLYGQGFLGYRWIPEDKKWFLRAGYTPLYQQDNDPGAFPVASFVGDNWVHWASAGFGIRF